MKGEKARSGVGKGRKIGGGKVGFWGPPSERLLEAEVARDEAELFIEPVRVRPALVGRQLHQDATPRPALRNGPFEHPAAEPGAAMVGGDPDPFDLTAQRPLPRKTGNEGDLKRPDHPIIAGDDREELIGVGVDRRERGVIRRNRRQADILPFPAQGVVGEEAMMAGRSAARARRKAMSFMATP